jgi:hypothetical protein
MAKKKPTTSEEQNIVKIQYNYSRLSGTERFMYFLEGFFALMIFVVIYAIIQGVKISIKIDVFPAIFAIGLILFTISIPLIAAIPIGRERHKKLRESKEIMANGVKIIGQIVSLQRTVIEDEESSFTYSYNVEYKSPDSNKHISITTPEIVANRMMLQEKDLPINVYVYVWKGNAFVESLINPPFKVMRARKIAEYAPFVLLPIILALVVYGKFIMPTFLAMIIIGACVIGLILCVYVKDNF